MTLEEVLARQLKERAVTTGRTFEEVVDEEVPAPQRKPM